MKNVFFNWVGMGVALVMGFVQAPIVVLGLGNTWYGVWALVNQLTGYTWLFDLGIREAVIRYVSMHHKRKEFNTINEIVSSAIYIYFFISLLTMAVVSILVILLPYFFNINSDVVDAARVVLFLIGLNIAINWFFNAYGGIIMGLQRFDIWQKIGMLTSVVNFVLVVTFINAGYGIVALSLIGFSVSMVSNTLIFWQCKKLYPEFRLLRFDWNAMQFRPLINYGKYVFMNNIASKVVFGTDVLIIGIFLPISAITFYSIPSLLVNYMRNLVLTATWALNPLISELESIGEVKKIKITLARGTKFSLLVGLPIGTVFLIMGKNFISLWMGREYGEATALVLTILTVGTLAALGNHVINSVLYGLSRHNIIANVRIAEAAVNIVLTVIFVQLWGIVGVALGMAVAHVIFMGVVLPILVCRYFALPIGQYVNECLIPPIISNIPFAVCCYFINTTFPATNLFIFFLWVASLLPVFIISAWFISFSRDEKAQYTKMICEYAPFLRVFSRTKI